MSQMCDTLSLQARKIAYFGSDPIPGHSTIRQLLSFPKIVYFRRLNIRWPLCLAGPLDVRSNHICVRAIGDMQT